MPPGYTTLDNDAVIDRVPDLGLAATAVYLILRRHCDGEGICWPAVPTIATEVGITARSVRTALRRLVALELLEIEHRRDARGLKTANRYRVLPSPHRMRAEVNNSTCGNKRPVRPEKNDPSDLKQTTGEQEPIEQEPLNNGRAPAKRFVVPTISEVTTYCSERKNQVDPQRFLDHYVSNGWRVGRSAMKDWRAAVRTWERNGFSQGGVQVKKAEPIKYRN